MAGVRIDADSELEVQKIAEQLGIKIAKVYPKRGQAGFLAYGQITVDNTKRIQVTQQQIDMIALVFKSYAEIDAKLKAEAEELIIDVEYKVVSE